MCLSKEGRRASWTRRADRGNSRGNHEESCKRAGTRTVSTLPGPVKVNVVRVSHRATRKVAMLLGLESSSRGVAFTRMTCSSLGASSSRTDMST